VAEDLDLGESDSEEETDFPPPERKIITQPYDLSVTTLVEQWNDSTLLLPDIQREYVWDNPRAGKLIESLLLNIPIPVLFFAETPDSRWEIFDGHQRIRSIVRFVNNEFALSSLSVLPNFNRLRFHQLPIREQRFLERRTIRAVVISNESHPSMKFETFERLNTGAIVLNAQEIRNSLYRGEFNKLLRELARNPSFRAAMGTKSPRRRMVDEELILRFFALRQDLADYRPPLKRFLNSYMGTAKDASPVALSRLARLFEVTIERLESVLERSAFRVADAAGRPIEPGVNRALFEAQMLAFSWLDDGGGLPAAKPRTLSALAALYRDGAFQDAIQRATGDRARTLTRVRGVVGVLRESGLSVSPPKYV
jgi:Protein of unknown function DUF262